MMLRLRLRRLRGDTTRRRANEVNVGGAYELASWTAEKGPSHQNGGQVAKEKRKRATLVTIRAFQFLLSPSVQVPLQTQKSTQPECKGTLMFLSSIRPAFHLTFFLAPPQ